MADDTSEQQNSVEKSKIYIYTNIVTLYRVDSTHGLIVTKPV